jgi:hypothetical protein
MGSHRIIINGTGGFGREGHTIRAHLIFNNIANFREVLAQIANLTNITSVFIKEF